MESENNTKYDKAINDLENQIKVLENYRLALEDVVLIIRQDAVTNGKYSDIKADVYAETVQRVIEFGKKLNELNVNTLIAAEVKLTQLNNHIALQKKSYRSNQ